MCRTETIQKPWKANKFWRGRTFKSKNEGRLEKEYVENEAREIKDGHQDRTQTRAPLPFSTHWGGKVPAWGAPCRLHAPGCLQTGTELKACPLTVTGVKGAWEAWWRRKHFSRDRNCTVEFPEQHSAPKNTEPGDIGPTEGLRAEDSVPVTALHVDLPFLAVTLSIPFVLNYILNDYG